MLPHSLVEGKGTFSTRLRPVGLCAERLTLLWGFCPRQPNVEGPEDSADRQRDLWTSPEDRERSNKKGSAQKQEPLGNRTRLGANPDNSWVMAKPSEVATLPCLLI